MQGALPAGLGALRTEALADGFRALERLVTEWEEGTLRFDRPGEALMMARGDGRCVGIGGITIDPDYPEAMRMRRFYVARNWRRRGISRALCSTLVGMQRPGRLLTVNAGTAEAAVFWEAVGFSRDGARPGHSHVSRSAPGTPRAVRAG